VPDKRARSTGFSIFPWKLTHLGITQILNLYPDQKNGLVESLGPIHILYGDFEPAHHVRFHIRYFSKICFKLESPSSKSFPTALSMFTKSIIMLMGNLFSPDKSHVTLVQPPPASSFHR